MFRSTRRCHVTCFVAVFGLWAIVAAGGEEAPAKPSIENSGADVAEDSADAPALTPEAVADRLEAKKEARLDVELKTGKSFLRSQFLSIVRAEQGLPKTLKIRDADTGRTISVSFASVRSLTIDREKIYEAPKSTRMTAKEALAAKQDKKADAEYQKWLVGAKENNAPLWDELTPEQHAQAVREHEAMIADVKKLVPGMELHETHEFMFCSNMPREQVKPYTASLDKMHDMMCSMYRIKKGTPIWRGKCLVVAFLRQQEFQAFEANFFSDASVVRGLRHVPSVEFRAGRDRVLPGGRSQRLRPNARA